MDGKGNKVREEKKIPEANKMRLNLIRIYPGTYGDLTGALADVRLHWHRIKHKIFIYYDNL